MASVAAGCGIVATAGWAAVDIADWAMSVEGGGDKTVGRPAASSVSTTLN